MAFMLSEGLGAPVVRIGAAPTQWLLLAGVAIIALAVRLLLSDRAFRFYARANDDGSRIHGRHEEAHDPDSLAERYLDAFLKSRHTATVGDTITMLIAPTKLVLRASERRLLGEERSAVTITRTIEATDSLTAVPVLRIEKGVLVGSLKVSIDGSSTRTLPYELSRGLVIAVLAALHSSVFGNTQPSLEAELIRQSISRHPISEESLATLLTKIDAAASALPASDFVASLKAAVKLTSACDFIFAVVDKGCGEPRRVTIEYDEPLRKPVRSMGSRVRRALGLGNRNYVSDLHVAAESRSYHLDARGPDSMYVEQAYVFLPLRSRTSAQGVVHAPDRTSRDEVAVVAPLRGDSLTHLYMRDMDASPLLSTELAAAGDKTYVRTKPQFVVELRERPPGILGPTMSLAFWVALVTWLVGIFYSAVFPATAGPGSAWPAVIFGVPALVSGWLLSKLSSDALRVISIPTFLFIAWVALNSAALVTLAALKTTGVSLEGIDIGPIHIEHPTWALMMASTAVCAIACASLFVVRATRYASTINERVSE